MQLRRLWVMVGVGFFLGCGSVPEGYGTGQQALVSTPTWTPLNLVGVAPPARYDHAMAYDSDRRVVVLFGGTTATSGGTEYQDTWEWSLGSSRWTEVGPAACQTATCPPARYGHTLSYDPGLQATILFGGHSTTAWLNDLWYWKDGRWTAVNQPGTVPDIRHNHTMVYDPVGQGAPLHWMLGGSVNNQTTSDLWALTIDTSSTVPAANWTSLGDAPLPDRYGHAMVYLPGEDAFYVFGGRSFLTEASNDLWKLSRNLTWSDVSPQVPPLNIAPSRRYQVSMAAYADTLVLFGGLDRNLVDVTNDTWEATEAGWNEITPVGTIPGPRGESAMVSLPTGLFLFGGRGYNGGGGSRTPLDDTYLYERPGPPPVDGGTVTPDGGSTQTDGGATFEDGGPRFLDPTPRYDCSSAGGGLGLALALLVLPLLLRRRRAGLLALLLLTGALSAAGLPALARAANGDGEQPRMKLAFLGLSAGTGGQVDLLPDAKALSEFVQSELGSLDVYDVMGHEEVRGLLGLEQQRQLLGCAASEGACSETMAPALDAQRILAGNLGKVGSRFVLNLTLVDLRTQRNISRTARHARDLEDLLDLVRSALLELVARDEALTGTYDRNLIPERIDPLWETPEEGLLLAPRLDLEVLATRKDIQEGVGFGVGLHLGWRMGRAGIATTLLLKPLGVRLAGRFHPVNLWRFLPYLEAGMAIFFDSFSTRVGLGFELDLRPFRIFFDLAYEYGITSWATASDSPTQRYYADSLLLGGGMGWSF